MGDSDSIGRVFQGRFEGIPGTFGEPLGTALARGILCPLVHYANPLG
jgi:hypothetical protein